MCSPCTNIPPSPLRRQLPVKCTYPYFKFGRLNAADLNKKLIQIQRQTLRTDPMYCIPMETKMAVAFSVIFMAHVEKQLPHGSHFSGRDFLMTYSQCGPFLKPKSTTLLISRTLPTQQLHNAPLSALRPPESSASNHK